LMLTEACLQQLTKSICLRKYDLYGLLCTRLPTLCNAPRQVAKQKSCTTACAIAEAGQSGQPAWQPPDGTSGSANIIGVLSHGPEPRTCRISGEPAQSKAQLAKTSVHMTPLHGALLSHTYGIVTHAAGEPLVLL
jgi:hypothetical protein